MGLQTHNKALLSLITLLLLVTGCSRKKDTFLSRNWHAVTAEYNTLYNGEVALEQGRNALITSYNDNFWEILPVERLEVFEQVTLPGESKDANFERAEEKAIKAIQRHSMEINGEERNPQMDEAFMLLGKARYYDQRFVRSLEAFNYILAYYPASNNIAQAKIWKEKANIRLDKNTIAIENLEKLLEEEKNLDDQDYADASAMLAQAYLNVENKDSALVKIADAAMLTRKNEERGRYLYIKGQLYDALGEPDLANQAYDQVIDLNRKSPRRYMINAYIAKSRNFDYDLGDRKAFYELLKELEANRENRPYLDRIDNQIAEYYLNIGEEDSAVMYYNSSLRRQKQDNYLQSRNYLSLATINFDNAQYQTAGAYYDSTINFLQERSREYRSIAKKRENLTDVIRYETTSQTTDSILRLVEMSEPERRQYFQTYIDGLKAQARQDSLDAQVNGIRNNEFFTSAPSIGPQAGGTFYFYNSTAVAQGKLRFRSRWGDRELTDNWRLSSLFSVTDNTVNDANQEVTDGSYEDPLYNVDSYLTNIPTAQNEIDSLMRTRNFANYQLGLIYKEKFKEYDLASTRLEQLLNQDPEERLVLPAKYYLYQIYESAGDVANSTQYKNDILTNHPNTRYASILKNPDTALAQDEESPEFRYNALYRDFENQKYNRVINQADTYITLFTGDSFVPKFELLKATAIGRLRGFNAYKEALNYVALNYPNQDEGKKAQEILNEVIPQIENAEFETDDLAVSWKLIFNYHTDQVDLLQADLKKLDEAIENSGYTQYYTSKDAYSQAANLLVVHGFNSRGAALSFAERLKNNTPVNWKKSGFTISTQNYRTIQIHKNLDAYLAQEIN